MRAADRQLAAGTPTEAAYTLRSWLHGFVLQLYLLSVGVYLLLAHALNPGRNPLPRQKLCFTSVPACCPHACYSPAVLRCMEHLAVPSQRLHLRRLRKSAASYGQLSSGVNTATCRRSCICSVSQPQAGCRLHRLAAFAPPPPSCRLGPRLCLLLASSPCVWGFESWLPRGFAPVLADAWQQT